MPDLLVVLDSPDPIGFVLPELPCPGCDEPIDPSDGYPETCPFCGYAP